MSNRTYKVVICRQYSTVITVGASNPDYVYKAIVAPETESQELDSEALWDIIVEQELEQMQVADTEVQVYEIDNKFNNEKILWEEQGI